MKSSLLLVLLCITLQSCFYNTSDDDDILISEPFTNYVAITMDRPTFEQSVVLEDAKSIINSGKIYVINDLLFVNEKNKGFHIFDNADPSSPNAVAYIAAPGSTDLAIKDDVYYINHAVDLIAVTYDKQTDSFEITKRIRNVFPQKIAPDGFRPFVEDDTIIIDYEFQN